MLGDARLTLSDVVAIPAPKPFPGWGVGGILSPQHLHPSAVAVMDLVVGELLLIEADDAAVGAWMAERRTGPRDPRPAPGSRLPDAGRGGGHRPVCGDSDAP